jgi:hypothetical protein
LTRGGSSAYSLATGIRPRVRSRSRRRGYATHGSPGRSRHPVTVSLLVLALILFAPAALLAGPFVAGPLVQVSGSSPFAACTADDVAGQIARDPTGQRGVFLNSGVEPWVDVNPANPLNIVAFWQQDRWSDTKADPGQARW